MEIAEQTAWYEDGGKTRVTKTVYKSGTVSINKHFYHDIVFNQNIKRGFILKNNSKLKLFMHMFLAYSAFTMMVLTYILQDVIR
tara:strand:+ start:54 stop:305 length:252 start_codon:yes stop_codon:yes gene_type:complete